jgi:hypothetical protein
MTADPADMEDLIGSLENESEVVSNMSIGRESIDTAELMVSVDGVIDQSYDNSNVSNTMALNNSRKSTPSAKENVSVSSSPRVIRSSVKKSDKKADRRVTADPIDMALLINSLKAIAIAARNSMNAKKLKTDMDRLISTALQLGGAKKKLTRKKRNSGRKTRQH